MMIEPFILNTRFGQKYITILSDIGTHMSLTANKILVKLDLTAN